MARYPVAKIDELEVDTMRKIVLDGEEICLAHAEDGAFYALGDICTHEEYSLSDGELWGLEVECPAHGSRFNLLTGGARTAPLRHQTLLAALDWSYDLLSRPERTLLCRLSVFLGGWTLDAAREIASSGDVFDGLSALVDKSLVYRKQDERYGMLDVIAEFAAAALIHTDHV